MDWKAENALNGLTSCPAIAHIDVQQQDDVHEEGIHDGRDGDDLIVEDEGTAGDGDGLCGVLHADFDDECAALLSQQTGHPGEQGSSGRGGKDEHGHGEPQRTELGHKCGAMLEKEDRHKEHKCWHGNAPQSPMHRLCPSGAEDGDKQAEGDGYSHQDKVLYQKITYRQLNLGGLSDLQGYPCHDEWQGE